jgi:hypothetical protein
LPYNGYLTVNPHTGNAVMGFLTWSGALSPNFRELVSTQLTAPMVIGQNYSVSFWICNGYTPYYGGGSNHIGLDFSTTPLTQPGGISNVVSLVPEYEIPGVFFSNGWVNYTFNITATAAWRYITFGNFYNDAATTATLFYAPAPFFRCYYFIDDVVIQTAVVLPLQLGMPLVSETDQGSRIQWAASNEDGIVKYQVERSQSLEDGFEPVAETVQIGKGTYELADNALNAPGVWYYRIRGRDAVGQSAFSEIVSFEYLPKSALISAIYPSPAMGGQSAMIKTWLPSAEPVELQLLDLQGRLLASFGRYGDAGENNWALPTNGLVEGIYLIRLQCSRGAATTKLTVAR